MMNKKAVALLSGGLDSTLAVCILKEQGIEIEAVNFQTMFGCCKDDARQAAFELGIGCTVLKVGDNYLDKVKNPKYGYGRGINPCVDCRIYMFEMAKELMEQTGAGFLISGEVLYQRPMSQKRKDLAVIDRDTGLEGRILRPLSAKLMPPTLPEKEGIVDRQKLYGIQGRSRARLAELAEQYGIENPPAPSTGCALTQPHFARKVRDIFKYRTDYERWEFEVLKTGRHFRIDEQVKVIVSRNQSENEFLHYLHPKGTTLMTCENFAGPSALVIGNGSSPGHLLQASKLVLRYAQKPLPPKCEILVEQNGETQTLKTDAVADEELVESWRIT